MNRRLVLKDFNLLEEQCEMIPEPPSTGVVVRICYAGLCHSDVHIYNRTKEEPPRHLPVVLGHEISGVIHSVGEEYSKDENSLKVGDKVVPMSWGGCLECNACNAGMNEICINKQGSHSEMFGIWNDGGFQHYLKVVNPWRLTRVPDDANMAVSCLVPCSGITAYHAIEKCRKVIEREIKIKGYANAIFNGAGGLSLWATEIIKAQYQNKVILLVADIVEEKLEDAKAKGADHTVCLPKEGELSKIVALMKNQLSGMGADAIVDFVNIRSTQMRLFNSLADGGTLVCVGLFGKEMAPINTWQLIVGQQSLQGCFTGTKQQVKSVFDLVSSNRVQGPPITLIKFEEIENRMKHMSAGSVYRGRYVVKISEP